jgi:hypothetical protein
MRYCFGSGSGILDYTKMENFAALLEIVIPFALAARGARVAAVGIARGTKVLTKDALRAEPAGEMDAYLLVADFELRAVPQRAVCELMLADAQPGGGALPVKVQIQDGRIVGCAVGVQPQGTAQTALTQETTNLVASLRQTLQQGLAKVATQSRAQTYENPSDGRGRRPEHSAFVAEPARGGRI